MKEKQSVWLACKHCGAISREERTHCALCGAALRQDMLLPMPRPLTDCEAKRIQNRSPLRDADPSPNMPRHCHSGAGYSKKTSSVKALLALFFGIAAVLATAFSASGISLPCGVVALVLGIVALSKKEGAGLAAAVGIGLGAYVLLVSGFWTFYSLFYLF